MESGPTSHDIEQQWALLNAPQLPVQVDSPCTIGRGILPFSDTLGQLSDQAFAQLAPVDALRFIPASGAATRMFAGLKSEEPSVRSAYLAAIDRLEASSSSAGQRSVPGVPLWSTGPKGAVPFHPGGRTAFEDQLAQWAVTLPGAALMFTLPHVEEPMPAWWIALQAAAVREGVQMNNSVQLASTQTISQNEEGGRFLDGSGALLLRPGGHGALIANLNALDVPLISVVNIDNVQPVSQQAATIASRRRLIGFAAHILKERDAVLEELRSAQRSESSVVKAAQAWLALGFSEPSANLPADADALLEQIDRPFRIVGVVKNAGQPGGGPFWVRNAQGQLATQIVERAELPASGPDVERLLLAATHFNPVDMVLCGQGYDLEDWIDHTRWLHVHKSRAGRPLKGLERPGLWNGAMGQWNTLMVEVPASTFAPVKTVLDLSLPAHQG